MGERIALARQQSGAEKLKGHDIMALERFDPEVRHMVVFDVLSFESPVGDKGDKMRLFLTDEGYQKALENQERGFIKLKNHAKVHNLSLIHIFPFLFLRNSYPWKLSYTSLSFLSLCDSLLHKEKLSSCNRTKAFNLRFTTCYNILKPQGLYMCSR